MDDLGTRYVAHLDILGMSTIVEKDLDEAWGLLSDLVAVKDKASKKSIEFIDTKEIVNLWEKIQIVTFSDTIILFTKSNTASELQSIIILLSEIFHKAMYNCVPIRAGLSLGKFYFNIEKSMYAGPALIEAYRVGEASQWLGISLGESIYNDAKNIEMKSGDKNIVVNWDIPLKDKTKNGYVINWPAIFSHDFTVKLPITTSQFYQGFERTFGSFESLPEKDKKKYINTVNFINSQLI